MLVKRAADPEGRSRLGHEADILSLARHPGVVELLDFTDDGTAELTIAWVQGPTIDQLGALSSEHVAGLIDQVARTIGDLHQMGIVHGRLDPDHVLVLPDGRPLVCGWSAATATSLPVDHPDSPGAHLDPAVDVAGLGDLMRFLVGPTQAEPIPEHRGRRRRSGTESRAALLTLADVASQDDPARRPTAPALATDILAVVPGACLPEVGAVATGPASATPSSPNPSYGRRTRETPDGLRRPRPDAAQNDPPLASPGPAQADQPWPTAETPGTDHAQPGAFAARLAGTPTLRRQALGALAVSRPGPDRFWSRHRKALVALVLLVLATFATTTLAGDRQPRRPVRAAKGPAAAPSVPPTTAAGAAPIATTPNNPATACAVVIGADIDGDGCADRVQVTNGAVLTDRHRYVVGDADDQVVLGDWNCDGTATPATLRRSSGEVFVFDSWADPGRSVTVAATTTAAPGSILTVDDSRPGGCPVLTLHEPSGPRAVTSNR